jgi:hypothetical protein
MVVYTTIEKTGDTAWRWTWTAGTGPYDAYLYGRRIRFGLTETNLTLDSDDYSSTEPPPLEVVDRGASETATSTLYPPYAVLQWRGNTGCERYRIDRYTAGAWVEEASVAETGRGYYVYESAALTDGETHQFRVVALDDRGYEADPVAFSIDHICQPDPSAINLSYSQGTGLITISEAA